MGYGAMDTMLQQRNCTENSCGRASVSTLDEEALCLKHFLARCYEELERLDPRGRGVPNEAPNPAATRAFIEECSRKALDVSLQSENLTNLERGRLLDILLWAGELFILLREPWITSANAINSPDAEHASRANTAGNSSF